METATFGGGCFWCTEAVFQRLKGVESAMPGYTGGEVENPKYEDVSSESTGHAESAQIVFDPKVISYDDLLDVFFATHDPTTLNRQGADTGTQYRSAIFYHDEQQKQKVEAKIKELEASGKYSDPIVTEVTKFNSFYEAEDYHKNYYNNNSNAAYCTIVIDPKLKKLYKDFGDKVKEDAK